MKVHPLQPFNRQQLQDQDSTRYPRDEAETLHGEQGTGRTWKSKQRMKGADHKSASQNDDGFVLPRQTQPSDLRPTCMQQDQAHMNPFTQEGVETTKLKRKRKWTIDCDLLET